MPRKCFAKHIFISGYDDIGNEEQPTGEKQQIESNHIGILFANLRNETRVGKRRQQQQQLNSGADTALEWGRRDPISGLEANIILYVCTCVWMYVCVCVSLSISIIQGSTTWPGFGLLSYSGDSQNSRWWNWPTSTIWSWCCCCCCLYFCHSCPVWLGVNAESDAIIRNILWRLLFLASR